MLQIQIKKNFYNNLLILFFFFNFILWDLNFNFNFQLRFLLLLLPFFFYFSEYKESFFSKNNFYLIGIALFFFIHYFLNTNYKIDFISILKIIIFLLTIFCVTINIKIFNDNFEKFIFFSLSALLILIILEIVINILFNNFNLNTFYNLTGCYDSYLSNHSFLFNEDSHLGMVLPSFLCVGIMYGTKNFFYRKIVLVFLITFILFISLSLTTIISIIFTSFIAILFCKNLKKKMIFLSLILIFSLCLFYNARCNYKFINTSIKVLNYLNINVFNNFLLKQNKINRINLKMGDINQPLLKPENIYTNLSLAVMSNSGAIAIESVKNNFLGAGFDRYKDVFLINIDQAIKKNKSIEKSIQGDLRILNVNDASNNFTKLIVEFGVFILIIFYVILKFLLNININSYLKLFLFSIIFIQFFFRGAGYFNGGFITSLILIFLMHFSKEIKEEDE